VIPWQPIKFRKGQWRSTETKTFLLSQLSDEWSGRLGGDDQDIFVKSGEMERRGLIWLGGGGGGGGAVKAKSDQKKGPLKGVGI